MIKGKEELVASLKAVLGDTPTDDGVTLLEDLTDSFSDLEKQKKDLDAEWNAKYDILDKEWKQRYTERFEEVKDIDVAGETHETEIKKDFEDLFETTM